MVGVAMALILATVTLMAFASHPLSLLGGVLLVALSVSYLLGVSCSWWFSFCFLMLYVGALLVSYAFISALAPSARFAWRYVSLLVIAGGALLLFPWDVHLGELRPDMEGPLLVLLGLLLFYAMVACSTITRKTGGAVRLSV